MKVYTELPKDMLECPVCNGTGRKSAGKSAKYKNVISGYNEKDDTVPCNNCGSQKMFGTPKGFVNKDKDGNACLHHYKASNAGRCLTNYECEKCADKFQIDSGD